VNHPVDAVERLGLRRHLVRIEAPADDTVCKTHRFRIATQGDDAVSALEKRGDNGSADEPSRAGYRHSHGDAIPLTPQSGARRQHTPI